jgi:hypothetical protein
MDQCLIAEKLYSDAVRTTSQLDGEAFEEALVRAQSAKDAFCDSEHALQRHVQQHGCFRHPGAKTAAA